MPEKSKTYAVYIICLFAIAAGSEFRFLNLGGKVACVDEQLTRTQVEGKERRRQLDQLYDHYVPAGALLDQNRVCPNSTIGETLDDCRFNTPFNPPLYFLCARIWSQWLGTSWSAMRSLPAVISLLEIPAWYFLGMTLFQSVPAAVILTALGMIAPCHLYPAQYARPYSLWTVLTLLASALLLQACHSGKRRFWVAYGAASLLNLYTHLSALRVLAGHVLYALMGKVTDRQFKLTGLLSSSLFALLLFAPWLNELNQHLYSSMRGTNWFTGGTQLSTLWGGWLCEVTQVIVDVPEIWPDFHFSVLCHWVPLVEALLIGGFLIWAPKNARLFLSCMLVATFFTLAVPDLIWHGNHSLDVRYMLPVDIALQCMFSFCISALIASKSKVMTASGILLLLGFVVAGAISCRVIVQSRVWWHNWGDDELSVAAVLNRYRAPILLGWKEQAGWEEGLISIAELLRPNTVFAFTEDPSGIMPIPPEAQDVFVWHPNPEQIAQLEARGFSLIWQKDIDVGPCLQLPHTADERLWKLVRK